MEDTIKWDMAGRASAPPGWAVGVHQAQSVAGATIGATISATTGATPRLCLCHLACRANRQTLKGTGPASELSACMNPQWFTSPPASELCPAHSYPPAACYLQAAACSLLAVTAVTYDPPPLEDIIIINGNTSASARLAGWSVGGGGGRSHLSEVLRTLYYYYYYCHYCYYYYYYYNYYHVSHSITNTLKMFRCKSTVKLELGLSCACPLCVCVCVCVCVCLSDCVSVCVCVCVSD